MSESSQNQEDTKKLEEAASGQEDNNTGDKQTSDADLPESVPSLVNRYERPFEQTTASRPLSLEERMKRKMEQFEKPSGAKPGSFAVSEPPKQTSATAPAPLGLEERLERKMAEFDNLETKPGAVAVPNPPREPSVPAPAPLSLEERLERKMAESDNSKTKPGAVGVSSEPRKDPITPALTSLSLEERMKRKMEEFGNSETKPGVKGGSFRMKKDLLERNRSKEGVTAETMPARARASASLEERMKRKMEEFDNSKTKPGAVAMKSSNFRAKRDLSGQNEPRELAEAVSPSTSLSLEQRVKRKMAEFDNNNKTQSEPSPRRLEDRYQEKLDQFKKNADKPKQDSNETPNPDSLEERMRRKMAELEPDVAPAVASTSAEDKREGIIRQKSEEIQERYLKKMNEFNRSAGKIPATDVENEDGKPGMEDRLQRKMDEFNNDGEGRASLPKEDDSEALEDKVARKIAAFQDEKPTLSPDLIDRRLQARMTEFNNSQERLQEDSETENIEENLQRETEGTNSRVAALPREVHDVLEDSDQPDGVALPLTTTVAKNRPEGGDAHQQPGAYVVQQRAIGSRPAWGRVVRSVGRGLRNMGRSFRSSSGVRNDTPPELRGTTQDQSHLPPEMRSGTLSNVPPELQGPTNMPPEMLPHMEDGEEQQEGSFEFIDDDPGNSLSPTQVKARRCHIYVGVSVVVILLAVLVFVGVLVFAVGQSGGEEIEVVESSMAPSSSPAVCFVAESGFDGVVKSCSRCNEVLTTDLRSTYFNLTTLASLVFPTFEATPSICNVQNKALYWLAEDIQQSMNNNQESRETRLLLAALYIQWTDEELGGWVRNTGWLTNSSVCDWYGVGCINGTSQVTELSLPNNNIKNGTLSSELLKLTNLTTLDLSGNSIKSSIASGIVALTNLHTLDIRGGRLEGSIPNELYNLTNLKTLGISGERNPGANGLSGSIPTTIGLMTNLEVFSAVGVGLTGRIPTEISNLQNLVQLELGRNEFTQYPLELWSLPNLEVLDLRNGDSVVGIELPTTIGNLQKLRVIDLQRSPVSGTIPSEIGQLTNLQKLNLFTSTGGLEMYEFEGSLPTSIGNMSALEFFSLSARGLRGTIPTEIALLSNLVHLDLGSNQFTGTIPSGVFNLTRLSDLRFRLSSISGSLPSSINLPSLVCLDIKQTGMTGYLPPSLCANNSTKVGFHDGMNRSDCNCCEFYFGDMCGQAHLRETDDRV